MARTKASELREMSEEQLLLTLKETSESLFRLRIQAATERLDAPSELRRHRRLIAQIKTVLAERQRQGLWPKQAPKPSPPAKIRRKKQEGNTKPAPKEALGLPFGRVNRGTQQCRGKLPLELLLPTR